MSFMETAMAAVKAAASLLRRDANGIGIMRSVDATRAAAWLREVACAMETACEASASDYDSSQVVMDREVTNHFEANAWNEWAMGMLKKYKLCEGHPPEAFNFDILTTAIDTALHKNLGPKTHREPILKVDDDKLMRDVTISVIGESIRQFGSKYIRAFEYLKQQAVTAKEWQLWALCLMDEHNICEKSALDEEFDVDVAQETIATCYRDLGGEIERQIELRQLNTACPEDYNAYLDGKQVAYLRLRHGSFTVRCPDGGGDVVYSGNPKGDGIFDDDEERQLFLQRVVNAIIKWVKREPEEKLAEFELAGFDNT